MKKYRKWILVLTALTVFYVVHVESLKATSLIHAGKFSKLLNSTSSNITTALPTTTKEPSSDRLRALLDEVSDDDVIDVNGTKITLTGIPQIDYVWDPNLPRELNGFNLSSYPFLDSMPADEDIGFDCEDKINGFYASVKYSCQLYHHCLYGVRSDFICANFTAFDQKTFICHFASEVDCKNSHKYWSRNDDLYKATTVKSTPTSSSAVVPLIDRGFYNKTRTSFLNGGHSNQNNANNSPTAALPSNNNNDTPNRSQLSPNGGKNNNNRPAPNGNNDDVNQRPLRPLRRPPFRRRPVDYYYYDDEYADDFYDERMRRRNRPRNRRPVYEDYDNSRRRPYYDDFDDYEYERRQVRPRNRNEERRRGYEERRPAGGAAAGERRRPLYEDSERIDERRRNAPDRRGPPPTFEERKISSDRKNNYEVEEKGGVKQQEEFVSDEKLIKPQGTSIFDRARPPPKISRPVPLSEKSKYAYNKNTEKAAVASKEEDSYEYEDEDVPQTTVKSSTTTKQFTASVTSPKPFFHKIKPATTTTTIKPTVTTTTQEAEYYEDEYYDTVAPTPKSAVVVESTSINPRDIQNEFYASTTATTLASSPESFRLNRYKANNGDISREQSLLIADQSPRKYANKQTVFDHVTQETPTKYTQETPQPQNYFQNLYNNRNLDMKQPGATINQHSDEKEQKVLSKIIKRPFLPSRGGNPYKARGLQPVGVLAQQSHEETPPATSERPKISLEELYNEEYDVDLNDALNPMLKPLTSSSRGNKDTLKAQSQIVQHAAPKSDTTEQPEYYDDEFEYSYADEVA